MAERLFNNSKFTFIGELIQGKEPKTTNKLSDTSKWNRTKLNIGVKDDSNSQFLNMEYIHTDSVKTCKILGKDGEMFDVNLADTNNPSTIEKASDLVKITLDLETDFELKKEYMKLVFKKRNHEMKKAEEKTEDDIAKIKEYDDKIKSMALNRLEFCHVKDAIEFLNSALPTLKEKKVRIMGQVKSNYYKGKNNLQFIPNLIELVPNETENQLKAIFDVFYDKDSIDDDDKLKKIIINGYIGEKIKKVDKLFPTTFVIDYTKIDETNETHKQLLDFMKDIFKITDKKKVHKMGVEVKIINGAEKVEFDESCLTYTQKMSISLGMNKLEDFKPKGFVYGDRIVELRVINGDFKTYTNGAVEVFASKDLTDYILQDDSDKTLEETNKETNVNVEENPEESATDMMAKLFG